MSFNFKITLVTLLLISIVPVAGWKYYQHQIPKPSPIIPREEITLTIIPGWNLRDVADYLVKKMVASSTSDVFAITGIPGKDKDSAEGSLAPETIRFFKGASVEDIIKEFEDVRTKQITAEMQAEIKRRKMTVHELLTMASIIEREARTSVDRKIVAGIMWHRIDVGMALQVDSSVHYAVDRTGDVFTTDKERSIDSLWNTYKHPGLPPGPICMPSVDSIMAALYPEKNSYWYFLTGSDGKMHYAKDLDAHNANRYKYLK